MCTDCPSSEQEHVEDMEVVIQEYLRCLGVRGWILAANLLELFTLRISGDRKYNEVGISWYGNHGSWKTMMEILE